MSLDIGVAFREGVDRTFSKNGLLLAAGFAGVALLTVVLTHTLILALLEASLEFFRGLSPAELDMDPQEFEEMLAELEATYDEVGEFAPLALTGVPASIAAGGLLVAVLLAEAISIVAVRVFATAEDAGVSRDLVTDNILLATLNGFIGAIVVWGLIIVGLLFFVLPGIFLAVAFYFLRQEIALNDKNFVQAMADSWRVAKGHRIEVFLIGMLVVLISTADSIAGGVVGFGSAAAGDLVSVVLGGLLAAFGAAIVTRAYVQLSDDDDHDSTDEPEDPYAKALGPDDLPR